MCSEACLRQSPVDQFFIERRLQCFCAILGPGRPAVLERWLPNSVTILDRFHCIHSSMR